MENKDNYYSRLKENNGVLNEIDLGETMGLDEKETREILAQLLSENKIVYAEHKSCHYRVLKKK